MARSMATSRAPRLEVGSRADDVGRDGGQRTPGCAFDNAEAASGQAGIDAEDAHAHSFADGEQVFECSTYSGLRVDPRIDARGDKIGRSTPAGYRIWLAQFGEDVVWDVEVAEDVLDVVGVLKRLDQPEDPLGSGLVDLTVMLGTNDASADS